MRDAALLFAVLMGTSAATYTICVKLAAARINPALGAMVVTGGAFLVNCVVLLVMRSRGAEVVVSTASVGWLLVAGVAAAGVDLFGLIAYGAGLQVTSSLIVTGVYTSLVLVAGFVLLREPFGWLKLVAILLIAAGVVILQRQGV